MIDIVEKKDTAVDLGGCDHKGCIGSRGKWFGGQ
jgi:hypothetical protein